MTGWTAAYDNAAGIEFDADGHAPATLALVCGYCKRGEITPLMEHIPGYYAAEEWAGMECDTCLAQWNKDGTPRKGPHRALFDYEQMVAFYNAQQTNETTQQAATDTAGAQE
jgi:hypothetical protein